MRFAPLALIIVLGVVAAALASTVENTTMRVALTAAAVGSAMLGAIRATGSLADAAGNAAGQSASAPLPKNIVTIGNDRRSPIIDRDTGLYADWYFRLRLEEEIQRASRFGHRFVVAIIETSAMNTSVTARLGRMLRHVDYAAGLGDKIAVVLPNTSVEGARTCRARLGSSIPADVQLNEYPRDGEKVSALLGEDSWATINPNAAAA